ncbi:MAG: hypothetical protein JXM71_04995, partial [Spirochaetales bacterium]|nr:hypothetical protein [Spirochaetales bacterium]
MNGRMRVLALAGFLLLACVAAAWGMGGREDPLVYAETLIKEQQYDEAIVYLTNFIQQYPDRFDAAQRLLKKINKIRTAYNESAVELLDVLINEPTNEERKLAMIRELESFERNPNPAVKEFVSRTKDLALFTYNRAKFEEIMDQGRLLIDERRFAEAARVYETGFVLYRPEFVAAGLEQSLVDDVFARVSTVSDSILLFEEQAAAVDQAFQALATAYADGDDDAVQAAWDAASGSARELMERRTLVVDEGRELEAAFTRLSAGDATVTENSFLPFAYRLILGRVTESKLEGVAGAMDAAWTGALGTAQAALEQLLSSALMAARNAYEAGEWASSIAGFGRAATHADRGVALLSLWSHYAPSDLVERSTTLGQAVLQLKGADYLRFVHAADVARAYVSLASVQSTMDQDTALLAALQPEVTPEARDAALAAFEERREAFYSSQQAIEDIRGRSGEMATRLGDWTEAGFGTE